MIDASTPADDAAALAAAAGALLEIADDVQRARAAASIIDTYRTTAAAGRLAFFRRLGDEFGVDEAAVDDAIDQYRTAPGPDTLQALARATRSRCRTLLEALNTADGGTAAVVAMRADLLAAMRSHPELAPVDADFVDLLGTWFNLGFLTLERFDWNTPASILEKLIEYEAVHEIRDWSDLRRRLAADRRCFAFFHAALPGEPLIFVEVALTDHVPETIREILDEPPPEEPEAVTDTAVFYSITNCQTGLRGISFGTSLLERVKEMLHAEFPSIATFVTLSPAPTFMRWLHRVRDERAVPWLDDDHYRLLHGLDDPSWVDHPHLVDALEPIVMRACATYLLERDDRGRPIDPVARFHLGNGAILERINWLGDTSWKGLTEAAGILVNYRYPAPGEQAPPVPASEAVRRLAAGERTV